MGECGLYECSDISAVKILNLNLVQLIKKKGKLTNSIIDIKDLLQTSL